jgi:hypothetical protein
MCRELAEMGHCIDNSLRNDVMRQDTGLACDKHLELRVRPQEQH